MKKYVLHIANIKLVSTKAFVVLIIENKFSLLILSSWFDECASIRIKQFFITKMWGFITKTWIN